MLYCARGWPRPPTPARSTCDALSFTTCLSGSFQGNLKYGASPRIMCLARIMVLCKPCLFYAKLLLLLADHVGQKLSSEHARGVVSDGAVPKYYDIL